MPQTHNYISLYFNFINDDIVYHVGFIPAVVLGFLIHQEQFGYDVVHLGGQACINNFFGNLYFIPGVNERQAKIAIKKLIEEKYIQKREFIQNRKSSYVYSVNDNYKEVYSNKLSEEARKIREYKTENGIEDDFSPFSA